jgi:hypothetical protein
MAAATFSATTSSVSPKSWRRSLWPRITQRAAGVAQHGRGDLPGEGALCLRHACSERRSVTAELGLGEQACADRARAR